MALEFVDQVVAVTGAGSGLGADVARAFAQNGAAVVCNDIDEEALKRVVAELTDAGQKAIGTVGDVSKTDDVSALVDAAVDEFGGLDVMHANAAISIYERLETMDDRTFNSIVDVNLKGPLMCARAAIAPMRERGGGAITFISSVQAYQGLPGCVPYVAAKAGLVAAARTLAAEVGGYGIRVNAIAPGTIDTPMFQRDLEPMNASERTSFLDRVRTANALGRIGQSSDISAAALFLASNRAGYVTGTCLVVDGGFLAVKAF